MLSIRVNESRQFLGDSRWRAQKKGWTSVRALSTMVSLMPQQAAPSPDEVKKAAPRPPAAVVDGGVYDLSKISRKSLELLTPSKHKKNLETSSVPDAKPGTMAPLPAAERPKAKEPPRTEPRLRAGNTDRPSLA